MREPRSRISRLRGLIHVGWSEARTASVKRRVLQSRRRQQLTRLGAAAAITIGLLIWGLRPSHTPHTSSPIEPLAAPSHAPPSAIATDDRSLRLRDQSVASPLDAMTQLRVREDEPQRTIVEVVQGAAQFDVVRRPERLFRVDAGRVIVEVLGTLFTVERGIEQVTVAVQRGRVRVIWDGHSRQLAAGQRGSFPPSEARPVPDTPPLRLASEDAKPAPLRVTMKAPGRTAFELLQAATAARRSGRAQAAIAPLQELLREHRTDPRAPMAAFILGKLQLEETHQPQAAALSFALCQSLELDGPLAEDALSREVKAWDLAGERVRAKTRAEEYLRRYPQGIGLAAVRRHGHLP